MSFNTSNELPGGYLLATQVGFDPDTFFILDFEGNEVMKVPAELVPTGVERTDEIWFAQLAAIAQAVEWHERRAYQNGIAQGKRDAQKELQQALGLSALADIAFELGEIRQGIAR